MVVQGKQMYSWISNAYVKYPCTAEGLRAAQMSVSEDLRVNLTLCFSQQQAAAVYAATTGTRAPAYVSPFVGRLDDIGQNGMDLIKNVKQMFAHGDGHVKVLAASIRNLEHLFCCFSLDVDLVTVPAKVLTLWAEKGFPMPEANFQYRSSAKAIPYSTSRNIGRVSILGTNSQPGASKSSWRTVGKDLQTPQGVFDSVRLGLWLARS
jgi:transaldolase